MDFLPEVRMDLTPNNSDDEELTDDREAIELKEDIDDFNPDKDIDVNDISNNEVIKKEKLPKPKKSKQDIDVQDIFNMPNSASANTAVKPNDNIKLTKKGKPRKQRPPMTEEHKEKLKKAREKAMLVRKQKAQERRSAKALDVEEKQLIQKQKQKRVSKLKKEVEEEDIDMNDDPPTRKTSETWITKKDLEEAQLQAIMSYEKLRKERKAEKQIRQKKEKEEEIVRQQIRRAVAPPQKEYNPFDICY